METLVKKLAEILKAKDMKLAVAESCTGGLLSASLTHWPGSSDFFCRGYITYSNEAKAEMLEVPADMVEKYGAVSSPVAEAMAQGCIKLSEAGIAISITGVAGPDGGTEDKPVGMVFLGYAMANGMAGSVEFKFEGDRESVRTQSCIQAVKQLITILERE